MSEHIPPKLPASPPQPAPDPVGDVVPGDPPVPITVWNLPKPAGGSTLPPRLIARLVANYTHPGAPILDLSTGQHRRTQHHHRAELVITEWPLPHAEVDTYVGECAAHLDAHGCLAVIVTSSEIPDQLGLLVAAGRAAGLRYLQHVVVANRLTARTVTSHRGATGSRSSERHIRIHTDVLLFMRPGGARD